MPLNFNEVDFSSEFHEKQFAKHVTQTKQYFDFKSKHTIKLQMRKRVIKDIMFVVPHFTLNFHSNEMQDVYNVRFHFVRRAGETEPLCNSCEEWLCIFTFYRFSIIEQ